MTREEDAFEVIFAAKVAADLRAAHFAERRRVWGRRLLFGLVVLFFLVLVRAWRVLM